MARAEFAGKHALSPWGEGQIRGVLLRRGGGGADLAVAHDLRHLLFLHIHGAEPSPLIGSNGQPQACRIFSGTPRPVKLRLTWRCGSWDTAAVACRMPRSVKALSSVILTVDAVALSLSDGRRTSIRLKVAAAAFSVAQCPGERIQHSESGRRSAASRR